MHPKIYIQFKEKGTIQFVSNYLSERRGSFAYYVKKYLINGVYI